MYLIVYNINIKLYIHQILNIVINTLLPLMFSFNSLFVYNFD